MNDTEWLASVAEKIESIGDEIKLLKTENDAYRLLVKMICAKNSVGISAEQIQELIRGEINKATR